MLNKHTIENSNNDYTSAFQLILQRLGLWDVPTTFDESLSWYQAIKYVLQYLLDKVIPPMQENDEKMNELISYYEEVVDYCNNYFDNLDVQEEINNKLDAMSESGELTNLIKNYVDPFINTQNNRISNFESSISSQITLQNNKIEAIGSGSPLVASSVAGMTDTTRVYVNTTDGHWYYYNGNVWVDGGVYQSAEDSDTVDMLVNEISKKITCEKTTFFNIGKNLFNPNDEDCVLSGYYNKTNELVVDASRNQTGFIPVIAGLNYTATDRNGFVLWFDTNKNFLSYTESTDFNTNGYVTAPASAKFARFLCATTNWNTLQVEQGNTPTNYVPYKSLLKNELYEITNIKENQTKFFEPKKNLFNPDDENCIYGGYYNANNIFTTNEEWNQTGFIPVTAGINYTANHNYGFVLWFDTNKNFLSSTQSIDFNTNGYVTAPASAKFARFVCRVTDWDTMQVEQGTSSTTYEPYGYYLKKKYLKHFTDISNLKFTSYGDSIVFQNRWQPYLKDYYNFESTTLGIGSTTVALVESVEQDYPCMINETRLQNLKSSNPDILAIMGGTNDCHRGVTIGTDNEFEKSLELKDKTTFKGAYSYLIETLLTWKPTLKIILLTPMHSSAENTYNFDYTPYAQAVRDVAEYYCLNIADTAKTSGISKFDHTTYTSDGLHPNDAGGKNIANIVISTINNMFYVY